MSAASNRRRDRAAERARSSAAADLAARLGRAPTDLDWTYVELEADGLVDLDDGAWRLSDLAEQRFGRELRHLGDGVA